MFRNKRALVVLALAVVVIMMVMSPLALAKSNAAATPAAAKKNTSTGSTELVNASRKVGQAMLFWRAAVWFNEVGPTRYGVAYNFPVAAWDVRMTQILTMLTDAQKKYNAGDIAGANAIASQVFALADSLKNEIEATIHAGGRSVGEYKHNDPGKKVLIFGSDPVVCGTAGMWLDGYGIANDIVMQNFLTNLDMSQYDVMIFDPEYDWYAGNGGHAHTGWYGSRDGAENAVYGGLSPADNTLFQNLFSTGKIGLVYMEPVFSMGRFGNAAYPGSNVYCANGQIPFLPVQFGTWGYMPDWVYPGAIDVTITNATHPITIGMNPVFKADTNGQWSKIDITEGGALTGRTVVATNLGPEVIGFNYGTGRGVLMGFDNYYAADNWDIAKILRNSVAWTDSR